MFKFPTPMRAVPSSKIPAFDTRVQFDAGLLPRLTAGHGELNARFAKLLCQLDSDPDAAVRATSDCSSQLLDLRRVEALWLYPVIARGVEHDPDAQRQLARLRLVMVALTRRVVRCFEVLLEAIVSGMPAHGAADAVSAVLAEYVQRNEREIYPLYGLAATQLSRGSSRVA